VADEHGVEKGIALDVERLIESKSQLYPDLPTSRQEQVDGIRAITRPSLSRCTENQCYMPPRHLDSEEEA
jgi:hypothetical protein